MIFCACSSLSLDKAHAYGPLRVQFKAVPLLSGWPCLLGYAPAPGANSVAPWPRLLGFLAVVHSFLSGCSFFGVRGLPPIFAPQPTTPVTFIFLLSRFALLHICIHIYICVKMYVCTYTTKCKCVHTYLYLHICVYFCIIYIYI